MKLLTHFSVGNTQFSSCKRLGLLNDSAFLWHVSFWEITKGRVLTSWQELVLRGLEGNRLYSCDDMLKMVLNDQSGGKGISLRGLLHSHCSLLVLSK